jgi:hypothetical protein
MRKTFDLRKPYRLAALALALSLHVGCGSEDTAAGAASGTTPPPPPPPDGCVTDTEFFAKQVWGPILSQACIGCHNPLGEAKGSKMVLRSSSEAGFLDENLAIVREVASFEKDGTSLLLLKPTASIEHGGGLQLTEGTPEYDALVSLVERFEEPVACEVDPEAFFADVDLMTPAETLRKACILLGGRLPTDAEKASVAAGGLDALGPVLDQLLTEDAFYERLKDIYNDHLLTDRYLPRDDGTNLVQNLTGKDARWYKNVSDPATIAHYGVSSAGELQGLLLAETNRAVAREPLELIAHVVRSDRQFTEIVTADYLLVNAFSAKAYGVTDVSFQDDTDPTELAEGHIPGYPHAGLLTSTIFLNRHPTTQTNRNRHRARVVYQWFLGTDILKIAEQPIDPTKVQDFNPTMNNPACTVCHANMDPIAGAFHTFDDRGGYDPADAWYEDMRQPGFGAEVVPFEEFPTSIQWLGSRIAGDPRFALSAVYVAYEGLTFDPPLVAPTDFGSADYPARFDAYLAQYQHFSDIALAFEESGRSFKTIVKGVVLSPYFRAKGSKVLLDDRAAQLADLGMGRLLPPELLNRKLTAIMGYPWRVRAVDRDLLTDSGFFRILYGGIDSLSVTRRIQEPNGIMSNIADRMANQMACWVVPRDFRVPAEQRALFPDVDVLTVPEDPTGAEVPASVALIKQNIKHLHERILGETLEDGDPELDRTYELFLATFHEGIAGMADPAQQAVYSDKLPDACRVYRDFWTDTPLVREQWIESDPAYAMRSWMSVVAYMLSDYDFLYE